MLPLSLTRPGRCLICLLPLSVLQATRDSASGSQVADELRFARKGSAQSVVARQASASTASTGSTSRSRWFRRTKGDADDDGFRTSSVGGKSSDEF